MQKKAVGFVASAHNQYDGTFVLGGAEELATGSFVTVDSTTGEAVKCAATPTTTVYFVAQENDRSVERVPNDDELLIQPGEYLKLMAPVRQMHVVTNQVAEELAVGDEVGPAGGVLAKKVDGEYIVREIIPYGQTTAYRCELVK